MSADDIVQCCATQLPDGTIIASAFYGDTVGQEHLIRIFIPKEGMTASREQQFDYCLQRTAEVLMESL